VVVEKSVRITERFFDKRYKRDWHFSRIAAALSLTTGLSRTYSTLISRLNAAKKIA
jgi:hypothetical protein